MTSKTTRDHDFIRRWAEERKGHPATVKGTGQGGEKAGILRIDFEEGENDEGLGPISWEEFFEKFDESGLVFLYGEGDSRFNKFVSRETAEAA